jgi:hydroxymethylpyrimidine/phosphomethylpyrimidine kinase
MVNFDVLIRCTISDKKSRIERYIVRISEIISVIYGMGVRNVVVKGGHLPAESDAIDLLYDGRSFQEFRPARLQTHNDHGTGCTFAATIAAELAKGNAVPEAVRIAKDYLTRVLRASANLQTDHGPMNHMALLIEKP